MDGQISERHIQTHKGGWRDRRGRHTQHRAIKIKIQIRDSRGTDGWKDKWTNGETRPSHPLRVCACACVCVCVQLRTAWWAPGGRGADVPGRAVRPHGAAAAAWSSSRPTAAPPAPAWRRGPAAWSTATTRGGAAGPTWVRTHWGTHSVRTHTHTHSIRTQKHYTHTHTLYTHTHTLYAHTLYAHTHTLYTHTHTHTHTHDKQTHKHTHTIPFTLILPFTLESHQLTHR